MKTIIEPFRIKSVEPINIPTPEERKKLIQKAHFNLFGISSDDVLLDLLTDSGTGAMSASQWSAIMNADESYAGSPSFYRFEAAVKNLAPFKHIIPTHQGRAAEAILFSIIGGAGKYIPNNTHFDTTRGNIEASGALGHDLLIPEGRTPAKLHPFKGNMDLDELESYLQKYDEKVPCVFTTITNNASGGQPVSLQNIKATAALARQYDKPFFIDGARFAENAWFIKQREEGQSNRSIPDIIRDCFSEADGMTMSAKKDAFANIGGWLALNDDKLADKARNRLLLTEGFPTYGGLSGRDLEAIAQGLIEVVDEDYLRYRARTMSYIVEELDRVGIPVVKPAGGHAVFIDARAWLPHIPPLEYPGQALAVALYELGGIRSCEVGSVMFGVKRNNREIPAAMDLLRLAIPRRTYTQSHADYLIEIFKELSPIKHTLKGFKIIGQKKLMRHFTCRFKKLN